MPPDESNLVEGKTGAELQAAGICGARLEWIETIKEHLRKEDDFTCDGLAILLNGRGISTATGGRWTGRIVKVFADRYMPDPMYF